MTRQTDYSILVLSIMAGSAPGALLTAKDLAKKAGLSLPMMSKILKILANKGFLMSHRGVKGGYSLKQVPSEISVAGIINALEGPVSMTECTSGNPGDCHVEHQCPVRGYWGVINQAVQHALSTVKLSSMTERSPQSLINISGIP